MKELIKHLWKESRDEIVNNSLLNCHAPNLHSIMLINKPGQRLRMFFAQENHNLWTNVPMPAASEKMSVGFHQHHCNITIVPIFGFVHNVGFSSSWAKYDPLVTTLHEFEYNSQILTGKQSFKHIKPHIVRVKASSELKIGDSLELQAQRYHTIFVPRDEAAAWFVMEGQEWTNYQPICMSNDPDLDKTEMNPVMYAKMNAKQEVHVELVADMLRQSFNGI